MLYFFLDDSGTDDRSPVTTMAGYVASSQHWAIFDKRAKKLYERHGIKILHASDFHGTKGEFAGWDGNKKMSFVRELFSLAKRSVMLGVSVTAQKEGYKAAGKRTGLKCRFAGPHAPRRQVDPARRAGARGNVQRA